MSKQATFSDRGGHHGSAALVKRAVPIMEGTILTAAMKRRR